MVSSTMVVGCCAYYTEISGLREAVPPNREKIQHLPLHPTSDEGNSRVRWSFCSESRHYQFPATAYTHHTSQGCSLESLTSALNRHLPLDAQNPVFYTKPCDDSLLNLCQVSDTGDLPVTHLYLYNAAMTPFSINFKSSFLSFRAIPLWFKVVPYILLSQFSLKMVTFMFLTLFS